MRRPVRLSVRRPAGRRGLAAVALLGALALTGCTPTADPEPGQDAGSRAAGTAAAQPVSVVGGTRPEERLLARVAVRHLQNRGFEAAPAEPSTVPWGAAGQQQVALVDSLAMAARLVPDTLAGPVPTPSPTPGAGASASPGASPSGTGTGSAASPGAAASDPAPASPTGHPTATGTPTPLPDGSPAADADATTAMVGEHFPDGTEVVGESPGTLRLQAVTTAAVSELYGMDELRELNGLCDRMVFTPEVVLALEIDRLEVLAGCEPAEWIEPGPVGPAIDLVTGRADVAMLYGTDPAIPDHALVPLADPQRILPEGRVLLVAEPQALPDGVPDALDELAGRLTGEALADLRRQATGPDALPPEEAAQYWLVSVGLEEVPEDWF